MTDGFLRYDTRLKKRARENRKNSTPAEQKAWNVLFSRKQFHGYKFTRQKMMCGFIVDFYCSELQLVVEIDGGIHDENQKYDKERSNELGKLGLRAVRYKNDEILNDLDTVFQNLTEIILV